MRRASDIMYRIGRIFVIIAIVCCAIGAVASLIMGIVDLVNDRDAAQNFTNFGTLLAWFVIEIVVLIMGSIALKQINSGSKENKPHIICIVIGAIGNAFYLLGGIFGLIANNQEKR